MKSISIHGRNFNLSIPHGRLVREIAKVAGKLNGDFAGKEPPVFLVVLKGAFMFAAELLGNIGFECEVSFVRLSSYAGTGSCGKVSQLLGITDDIAGRDVVVLEDIVETGRTVAAVEGLLREHSPRSVRYAAMFFKPAAYRGAAEIEYYAMELPEGFVVGFGLDYDGLGRNLADIYTLAE